MTQLTYKLIFTSSLVTLMAFSVNVLNAQKWNWMQSHESPNVHGSYFNAIAADYNGAIYSGGVLQDTVYFNTDTLPADYWWDLNGYGDMVLAKYDELTGEELWAKRYGGKGFSLFNDLECDAEGNVYVVAHFIDSLLLGNDTLLADGFMDGLILKFDPDGNILWYQQMTGPAIEYPNVIEIAASGTIIVAGYYTGIATWDGTFFTHNNNNDCRLMTVGFDPEGNLQWQNTYSGADFSFITSMASKDESLWICGAYEGDLEIGQFSSTSNGFWDPYAAKLDTLGNVLWLNTPGDDSHDLASGIVVDELGGAYVSGSFSKSVDWGGTAPILYASSIYQDAFIVKLDKHGEGVWANKYSGTHLHQDFLFNIDIDQNGGLYASGFCRGGIEIGDSIVEAPVGVGPTFLVMKTNTLGEDQWAKGFGFGKGDALIYHNQSVFVNGHSEGEFTLENGIEIGGGLNWRPTVARIALERLPTSISENISGASFSAKIQGNPGSENLRIKLSETISAMTMELFDISGKLLSQYRYEDTDLIEKQLSVPSGTYIIRLKHSENDMISLKWVKN